MKLPTYIPSKLPLIEVPATINRPLMTVQQAKRILDEHRRVRVADCFVNEAKRVLGMEG